MKSKLVNFEDAALNYQNMKAIKAGCGVKCYFSGGGVDGMYGMTKKEALSLAAQCNADGGHGYWCCASC